MKAGKWFLLILAVGLLSLMSLPFTAVGTRLLVHLVDELTPLELGYLEGSLAGNLKLADVHLNLASTSVALKGLELELETSCLINSRVCLSRLVIAQADIVVSAQESPPKAEVTGPSEQLLFPFAIAIEQFDIARATVAWPGGSIANRDLRGALEIDGSTIRVGGLQTVDSELQIESSQTSSQDTASNIEAPQVYLPFELIIDDLRLNSPRWKYGDIQHGHESLEFSGRWTAAALAVEHLGVSSENWGRASVSGKLQLDGDWPMDLEASVQTTQPPLWGGLHDRHGILALSGSLARLQLAAKIQGVQSYQLAGTVAVLSRELPFDLSAAATWSDELPAGDIPGLPDSMSEIRLSSPWTLTASGSLDSQAIALAGNGATTDYSQLELQLNAMYEGQTITIEALTINDRPSDSALAVDGSVSIDETLVWNLNFHSDGMRIPSFDGAANGRIQGSLVSVGEANKLGWQVEFEAVDLSGAVNDKTAEISGYAILDSELWLGKSDLQIRTNAASLSVLGGGRKQPRIVLSVPDLTNWTSDSRGSLNVEIALQPAKNSLEFEGEVRELDWLDISVPLAKLAGRYSFDEKGDFGFTAALDEVGYGDGRLANLRLKSSGDTINQAFNVEALGDLETRLDLRGRFSRGSWAGQLQPASVLTAAGIWRLDEPINVTWGEVEGMQVSAHCWMHSALQKKANLCVDQLTLAEQSVAALKAAGDLQLFATLIPASLTLEGGFELAVEASWDKQSGLLATGSAELHEGSLTRITEGEIAGTVHWDDAQLTARVAQEKLDLRGKLRRDDIEQLQLELILPASSEAQLTGAVALTSFELSEFLSTFLPQLAQHSGELNGELLLAGTRKQPLLNGQMELTNGNFSVLGNPTGFEQVNLRIQALGETVDVSGRAEVGGGDTQLNGKLFLRPEPKLSLEISGKRQTILVPPGIEAIVSENLQLFAEGEELQLRGEITVHEGVLEHEELPEGSVDVSRDVVEVDYRGELLSKPGNFDIAADVQLYIQDAFQVKGTGLTTTVGGKLNLLKKSTQPLQLFGELNILEGEISAFGQSLEILRGNLSFVGEPENPDLNLHAQREIADEGVTIGVEVLGSLETFAFSLYSTPNLPEGEMMSYLIRGRGLDKGTDADASAVALSLGLGAVNRTGIVKGLNKLPGVSDISFSAEGQDDETTATVSGYLGKRLYLAYGVGVYEPINVLTARLYMQTRLWLEVVSALESSVDIYYAFDID